MRVKGWESYSRAMRLMVCLVVLTMGMNVWAGTNVLKLWAGAAPDETQRFGEERDTTAPSGNKVGGRPVIRLGNVTEPTVTIYPAPREKANGAAVLVCPGGGYSILAMDLEGTEIAGWLNSAGLTACVLKYRVPVREGRERYAAPLQDAQRAMGLIRQKAKDLAIDIEKVGVMGFSAGAHLSAVLSNHSDERTYNVVDDADQLSSRPDFVMLIYPGYLANKQGVVSPELTISSNTPPTFIVQTQDDSVPVEGALAYYAALKAAKVPVEMHLYAKGGHGYGMRPSDNAVAEWPRLAERWFRSIDVAPLKAVRR